MYEKKRYFTDEELKILGKAPKDGAIEYAKQGNTEEAIKWIEKYAQTQVGIHDLYREWITTLMTYIYENDGLDALREAMKQVVRGYFAPSLFQTMDYRQLVETTLMAFFGHGSPMDIEEDDEKLTFYMKPCGGGQAQLENGDYDSGRFSKVEQADITWNNDNFPIYCIHAAVQDLISINDIGYPLWVYTPCDDIVNCKKCTECSCKISIYKDPADIPEEAFTRVNLKRPSEK